MEDWREFEKRRLRERLEQQAKESTAAEVKTALVELDYLEEVLYDCSSQAHLFIALHTFMNVQARIMRLQLEAMLKE